LGDSANGHNAGILEFGDNNRQPFRMRDGVAINKGDNFRDAGSCPDVSRPA
jgi:hypothetical protein